MLLSEFVGYFDFDYKVVNGFIRLIDLQDAYLGDIGECRYGLSDNDKAQLVDRLDIYIKDYVTDDLEEQLQEAGVENTIEMSLGKLAEIAKEKDIYFDNEIVEAIINPETIEFDKDKIIESFSVGQVFYEKDTEKFIVLDKLVNDTVNLDIWSFKVYDKDMQYLYDTTALDVRLAQDIIGGYIQSVTHEKVLRVEPDCLLEWKGELSATLEENAKLWERFEGQIQTDVGELKYVTVDYNPHDDNMVFKLHYEKVTENNLDILRNVIDVAVEPEEKETLLKEMKAFKPDFFDKLDKPSLNEVINDCAKKHKLADVININKKGQER